VATIKEKIGQKHADKIRGDEQKRTSNEVSRIKNNVKAEGF